GCLTSSHACKPLWTADTAGYSQSSPAIANGVVYVGGSYAQLDAFSAAGTAGCSGNPKACNPLLAAPIGHNNFSSPAVADGVVYIGSADGKLYAFSADGKTNT